jgi:uncharacterized protein
MPPPKRLTSCATSASDPSVSTPALLYLDASALVKLVLREPETPALVDALPSEARLVASEIAEIELLRAVRRAAGENAVESARSRLESVRLLPLSRRIRRRACELAPAMLRTLDAVHLATALDLGELLDAVYVYDARLGEAAKRAGLRVLAPSGERLEPK